MKPDPVRGHLDGMLLAVLEPEPLHGYAIITAIRERSQGTLALKTGTIYPALNRLEREGLLRSEWDTDRVRRRRRYELTAAGRRRLSGERAAWREFTSRIGAVLDPGYSPPAVGTT